MANRKTPSRYIPKYVKEAVRRRDRDICQECGDMSEYMEFDHITPFSKGAPATVENLQQLCRRCNLKKRDKTAGNCPKCNGWLSHDAKHCHHCGSQLAQKSKELKIVKPERPAWKRKALRILYVILILDILYMWFKFSQ